LHTAGKGGRYSKHRSEKQAGGGCLLDAPFSRGMTSGENYYRAIPAIIAATATAITAVAHQPTMRSPSATGNSPITRLFAVMCIIIAMIGTPATPLITAPQ